MYLSLFVFLLWALQMLGEGLLLYELDFFSHLLVVYTLFLFTC